MAVQLCAAESSDLQTDPSHGGDPGRPSCGRDGRLVPPDFAGGGRERGACSRCARRPGRRGCSRPVHGGSAGSRERRAGSAGSAFRPEGPRRRPRPCAGGRDDFLPPVGVRCDSAIAVSTRPAEGSGGYPSPHHFRFDLATDSTPLPRHARTSTHGSRPFPTVSDGGRHGAVAGSRTRASALATQRATTNTSTAS